VAQGEEGPRPPIGVPPNTTTTGPAPAPPPAPRPQREVVREIIAEAWRFAGPLPPPELFAEYDRVLPGSAERILAMAEREQKHRHDVVSRGQQDEHTLAKRGQAIAAVLGGMVIVIGGVGMVLGRPLEGLGAVLLGAASLVTVFIVSRSKEPGEKNQQPEDRNPTTALLNTK